MTAEFIPFLLFILHVIICIRSLRVHIPKVHICKNVLIFNFIFYFNYYYANFIVAHSYGAWPSALKVKCVLSSNFFLSIFFIILYRLDSKFYIVTHKQGLIIITHHRLIRIYIVNMWSYKCLSYIDNVRNEFIGGHK